MIDYLLPLKQYMPSNYHPMSVLSSITILLTLLLSFPTLQCRSEVEEGRHLKVSLGEFNRLQMEYNRLRRQIALVRMSCTFILVSPSLPSLFLSLHFLPFGIINYYHLQEIEGCNEKFDHDVRVLHVQLLCYITA